MRRLLSNTTTAVSRCYQGERLGGCPYLCKGFDGNNADLTYIQHTQWSTIHYHTTTPSTWFWKWTCLSWPCMSLRRSWNQRFPRLPHLSISNVRTSLWRRPCENHRTVRVHCHHVELSCWHQCFLIRTGPLVSIGPVLMSRVHNPLLWLVCPCQQVIGYQLSWALYGVLAVQVCMYQFLSLFLSPLQFISWCCYRHIQPNFCAWSLED